MLYHLAGKIFPVYYFVNLVAVWSREHYIFTMLNGIDPEFRMGKFCIRLFRIVLFPKAPRIKIPVNHWWSFLVERQFWKKSTAILW